MSLEHRKVPYPLWRRYAAASTKHIRLLTRYERAAAGNDVEAMRALESEIRQAEAEREIVRDLIRRTSEESGPKRRKRASRPSMSTEEGTSEGPAGA